MDSAWQRDLPRPGRAGRRPSRLAWVVVLVAGTVTCFVLAMILGVGPRTAADALPRQLAHDAAARLGGGASPATVVPRAIDIGRSNAPFVIVFDVAGRPAASSATLDGTIPVPPPGVFAYVDANGEDHLTWQPAPGLREATVITRAGGARGYVLAAQPLGDISARELAINGTLFVAWLVLASASIGGLLAASRR